MTEKMRSAADGMIYTDMTIEAVSRRPTAEEYKLIDGYVAQYIKAMNAPPVGLHYLPGGLAVYLVR
jgi:hypothetical protein